MATEKRARTEPHGHDGGHHHRDVSGGWLRPAVFGAMDGLVTNVSLIAGVGGGGASAHTIVLTGLAGLAAGACSMAAGEFVSVSSQNELIYAEVNKERLELENNAAFEQAELATMLRARGVSAATARQAAAEISAQPGKGAGRAHAGRARRGLQRPALAGGGGRSLDGLIRRRRDHPAHPLPGGLECDGRRARPRRRSLRSSAGASWPG